MGILDKIIKKDKEDKPLEKDVKPEKVAKKQKKETASKVKKISKDKMPNRYFDLIRKPHISEKTFNLSKESQYVFIVSDRSNKSEIKKAVESLYGVSVVSVNVISVPSKPKMSKGKPSVKSGYRKAIVKLAKGHSIDVMKETK